MPRPKELPQKGSNRADYIANCGHPPACEELLARSLLWPLLSRWIWRGARHAHRDSRLRPHDKRLGGRASRGSFILSRQRARAGGSGGGSDGGGRARKSLVDPKELVVDDLDTAGRFAHDGAGLHDREHVVPQDRRVDASGNLPARAQPPRRPQSLLQHATLRADVLRKNTVKCVRHSSARMTCQKCLDQRRARELSSVCEKALNELSFYSDPLK